MSINLGNRNMLEALARACTDQAYAQNDRAAEAGDLGKDELGRLHLQTSMTIGALGGVFANAAKALHDLDMEQIAGGGS